MRIQSPGTGGSSVNRPILIARLTPLTSTLARSGWSGRISITSPGMPRHMSYYLRGGSWLHLADLLVASHVLRDLYRYTGQADHCSPEDQPTHQTEHSLHFLSCR